VPIGRLIARAATRYLSGAGRTVARELVGEVRRRQAAATAPEPMPVPRTRAALAVHAVWWAGAVALVLVILNVDLLLPHDAQAGLRIVLGAVLLPAGLALAFERGRIRPLLLARFPPAFRAGGRGFRSALRRLLIGAGLRLLGIVWIGAGAFELLRGIRDLA